MSMNLVPVKVPFAAFASNEQNISQVKRITLYVEIQQVLVPLAQDAC